YWSPQRPPLGSDRSGTNTEMIRRPGAAAAVRQRINRSAPVIVRYDGTIFTRSLPRFGTAAAAFWHVVDGKHAARSNRPAADRPRVAARENATVYCVVVPAEVAERQTRRSQKPLPPRACGFESHLRHPHFPRQIKENVNPRFVMAGAFAV